MQVPERLALIGGSILLASTLIFTLKSQASNLLPKIEHPINSIYSHASDAGMHSDFDSYFQQAQQKGWRTGYWGTAKFYIDDNHNMYVGKGDLGSSAQGNSLRTMLGNDTTDSLQTLNIEQPVKAPQDSSNLFSTSNGISIDKSDLQEVSGLENVDTSQVTKMLNVFTNDSALTSIEGISNWNVSNVNDMGWMFYNTSSLKSLDVSGWNDNNSSIIRMFGNTGIRSLNLGPNTRVDGSNLPSGNYQNGNTITDGNGLYTSHPGTWVHQ